MRPFHLTGKEGTKDLVCYLPGGVYSLDWSKIDNDKKFQRLVNHLFAIECDSPGYIPSSPYIGADGGWDGRYEGYYSQEGKDGVWSVQSKWTTKSFKDAMPHLAAEVKKELENAAAKNVNHLRIATNAELDIDQVLELQNMSQDSTTSLLVWHREELTRRIELQPFLRHLFFGDPQFPKFVPWNIYFTESEPDLLPTSDARIRSFEDYLIKAREFLLSATSSVLLISSPGGYGKSHLLRSIAQIAHGIDRRTQVWMIRGSLRTMQDAMQDEIVAGRRYLLLFDDADRFLDEIKPLLSRVRGSDSIKVIFALRTSGWESVYRNVRETRLGQWCEEIRISDWNKNDLITLLRAAAKQEQVQDESTIVALYPNPFLIVWIGRAISGKSVSRFDNIKRRLVDDMNLETMACLGTSGEVFLVNLACVVPLPRDRDNSLAVLGAAVEVDEGHAKEMIDKLVDAGLLRVVGRNVRFNPDMKGDLYLADRLQTITQSKLEGLIGTWLPICAEKLLINLASAARFANVPSVDKSLSNITRSWAKGDISPFRSRKEVLEVIERLAAVIPEQCVDVLDAFLNSTQKLTTDDYGPAISALIRITTLRHRVLETIRVMHAIDIQGSYHNYHPQSLVRIFVSPLHNSIQTIEETLNIVDQWLDRADRTGIELVSAALCEVLAGTHEDIESGILAMTISERSLKDTPEVRGLREQALTMLERMIDHDSLEVKLAAIAVAEQIGSTRMRSIDESTLPLSATIREERELVTKKIGALIGRDLHFALMNKIEQLFLTWWAQRVPGTDETERYLETMPRSAEYIAFSYYASSRCVVENFAGLKSGAPAEDRWKWFVHTHMRHFLEPAHKFKDLVAVLNQDFGSPQQVIELLCRLDKALLASEIRAHPPIVSCWVKTNPAPFATIRKDHFAWQQVPEWFKGEIQVALAEIDEKAFLELAEEVLSELPDTQVTKAELFLSSLSRHPLKQDTVYSELAKALDEGKSERTALLKFGTLRLLDRVRMEFRSGPVTPVTVYGWLSILLTRGSSAIRSSAVLYLCWIAERLESIYLVVKLLRLALWREKQLSDAMLHNLHILILNKGESIKSLSSRTVDSLQRDLLDRLKDLANLDHPAQDLLEFACPRIDALADFVESRIRISMGTSVIEYQAIPFGGIPVLGRLMKSFDDYEAFMIRITSWHGRGSVWQHYLKVLMEDLCEIAEVKRYTQEYVQKQLENQSVTTALMACGFLPFSADTLCVFNKVGEQAISSGEAKEIESLLHSKILPRKAWLSSAGETSRELLERKTLFQQMRKDTNPSELNAIIDDCIERIDKIIEFDLRVDQEILNPRA